VSDATASAATVSDTGDGATPLVDVEHLKVFFPIKQGILIEREVARVHAVNDVTFAIAPGETLGLVGESGCGKTTLSRAIMRLIDSTEGLIRFHGDDVTNASRRKMEPMRRDMQMVFQDPFASLNPRKRVGQIIGMPLRLHGSERKEVEPQVKELLDRVGLHPEHINRFPHEFSGGQRQRIGVARALAVNPKLIVCDEPVSALDVSVQAQILNLLKDLQRDFGLTYIFIAHDLNVVRHISDRVMVMYLGQVVETANRNDLYQEPKHPYTGALLSAVPVPDPEVGRHRKRIVLEGDVPSPINPPSACRFHPRCPRFVEGHCDVEEPALIPRGTAGSHTAKCHYPLERWPMTEDEMRQRGTAVG
jgi:oligopeptide/dipeptide ABC transporter ATP-binding protein